ncbi:MAG: pilus assembly protein CpaE [Kineosporiaceae bacterium]
MVTVALARELRASGLVWKPASGDRFVVTQPALEGEVFTVSEMTIEAHDYPTGTVLGFNGTTEWALDSVALEGALWLPREDQLRELLGGTFRTLERDGAGYRVTVAGSGRAREEFTGSDPSEAYGRALLALVRRSSE